MAKKQVTVSLRKPPSPETIDAFVASGAGASATPATPAKRSRSRRASEPPPPESGVQVQAAEAVEGAAAERAEVREDRAAAPEAVETREAAVAAEVAEVAAEVTAEVAAEVTAEVAAQVAGEVAAPVEDVAAPVEEVTPAAPGVAPAAAAPTEPPVVDVAGRPLRPVTVYLPHALAERLTVHCIEQDRDFSNVIGEALEQHLSKRLGAGSWSPAGSGEHEARRPGASQDWGPFRWAEPFPHSERFERIVQIGRVVLGLWQKRPWAA